MRRSTYIPVLVLVLLSFLFLPGCGESGSCLLRINLPDDRARDLVASLEIWALSGSVTDCQALTTGESKPGDPATQVLAHLRVAYPPTADQRGLDQVPVGSAVFFVEGRGSANELLVNGCQAAEVVSSGTVEVVIDLVWVCQPVEEICDNQIDDDCDGATDEDCVQCEVDGDCDDQNPCTIDFCTANECHQIDFPADTPCSDDDPCTVDDTCQSGQCTGSEKDCSAFEGPCNLGGCDSSTGECVPEPKENGMTCDDGQWCTDVDTCQDGTCSGEARSCEDDDPCTQDTCNEGEQVCDHISVPKPGAEGPPGDETCANSIDDDCDNLTDGSDPNCTGCTSDSDCDDGNSCTEDACEGLECNNEPVADGVACSDGLFCTVGDHCFSGTCEGVVRDCGQGAGICEEGVCLEEEDRCEVRDRADGSPCDDSAYCTVGDQCASGACEGGVRNCDDGDRCTRDECDEANNQCSHELEPVPDAEGLSVDDSCLNTIDDDCDGLTDQSDPDCIECSDDAQCGDGNPCTVDSCAGGVCANVNEPDHTVCEDAKWCTVDDGCMAGVCTGTGRDCSSASDPCHEGVCDEDSDECIAQQVADGASCDDGNYCTVQDECLQGTCTGDPRDCDDDNNCTLDECDEAGDACTHTNQEIPDAEGPPGHGNCRNDLDDDCDTLTDLDDPDCADCLENDECNDNNPCTEDLCDWGVCENTPLSNGSACSDGLWCTTNDACQDAFCSGTQRDCGGMSDECHDGMCDEATDQCLAIERPDGSPCDDSLYCSRDDVCDSGNCTGWARDCDYLSDACHDGVCDDDVDECVAWQKADGSPCEDGFWCTQGDECESGTCSGPARNCEDGDVCTIDACDEDNTQCTHTQNPQGTEGQPGQAVCINGADDDCDGLTDLADPDCYNCVDDSECDDGNTCTSDTCGGGLCHNDSLPDNSGCEDAYWCTVADRCLAGVCSGNLRGCEDVEDACHDGVCDLAVDACVPQQKPDGSPCEDGLWCTVGETCQSGACEGVDRDCADEEPCTLDTCVEESDSCLNAWNPRPEVADLCGDGIDQDCDGLPDGCCLSDGTYSLKSTSPIGPNPWYMIAGDFNLDAIPDLATVNRGDSTVSVLLGNGAGGAGDGTFQPANTLPTGSNPYGIVVADLDADHRPDLVTANNSGNSLTIHWGQGGGAFGQRQDISFAPVVANPVQVVVGDFNADRIPDLATCNWGDDSVGVLLGQGSDGVGNRTFLGPDFYPVGATGVNPRSLTSGDFNADGILDLAVANWNNGRISVLRGGGTGGRGDGTFGSVVRYEAGNSEVNIASADFNEDGILDLAVVAMNDNAVNILLGDGSDGRGNGTFLARSAYSTGSTPVSVSPSDLGGDGILDLVVAEWGTGRLSVLPGSGSNGHGDGSFGARSSFVVGANPSAAVAVDSTGDGIFDLASCNNGPDTISLLEANGSAGIGDGSFVLAGIVSTGDSPSGLAVRDLNADQILDLVVVHDDESIAVYAGDGINGRPNAQFFSVWSGSAGSTPRWVDVDDFDGDRIPDLLVANSGDGTVGLFTGEGDAAQGTAIFGSMIPYPSGASPVAAGLADLNADAIGDLVSLDSEGGIGVRLGEGIDGAPTGSFGGFDVYAAGNAPAAFARGDVDNDGILDLVVANRTDGSVSVMIGAGSNGIGTGGFSLAGTVPVGLEPVFVQLVDLDKDGWLDLVSTNQGDSTLSIRFGQGDGSFLVGADPVVGTLPVMTASADLDGDTWPDLVSANRGDGTLSILLGHGDGSFQPPVSVAVGGAPSAIASGHFDWDGRRDLAVLDADGDRILVMKGTGFCTPH